jgi:hypothetical protein
MFFNLWSRINYFLNDFSLYIILVPLSFIFCSLVVYKIFKSKISLRNKKIYSTILFTLLILVLIYTAFEAYFRFIYDQPDGLGFLKVNKRWHERHVVYNSYFFRDRDFNPVKKEGVTRIGVLGDSIAFGGGIENVEDRFSNILEKNLISTGYNVEVYNLGKLGYDTEGEIQVYESVKHLNFDIIIWEYFLNDIQPQDNSTGTPIIVRNSKQGQVAKFLSDRSFFFDFLYWRFSSKYDKTLGELRTADLERYKDHQQLLEHQEIITSFVKNLQKENKKIIEIIFPFLYLLGPEYQATDIHDMMSNYFRENGVAVIDMLDYLKDKEVRNLWASEFDSHPNESVHKLAAEKLFKSVEVLLK